jgi:formylglycine-generating enzyme required for sulfatase activity
MKKRRNFGVHGEKTVARATPAPHIDALPPPSGETAARAEFKDCPICPRLIALPRGAFTMGGSLIDQTEQPARLVTLDSTFAGLPPRDVSQIGAVIACEVLKRRE